MKRYYKINLIYPATVLAVAGLMLLAGDALAGQGCITAKCHQGMLDHKFVHGPVAVQDCLLCHKQTGEHKFTLAAKGAELCYICHDKMPRRHGVECTKCHDPHGSDREFQLKPGA